jgi:hypothetical protein
MVYGGASISIYFRGRPGGRGGVGRSAAGIAAAFTRQHFAPTGLTTADAKGRLAEYGANLIKAHEESRWLSMAIWRAEAPIVGQAMTRERESVLSPEERALWEASARRFAEVSEIMRRDHPDWISRQPVWLVFLVAFAFGAMFIVAGVTAGYLIGR